MFTILTQANCTCFWMCNIYRYIHAHTWYVCTHKRTCSIYIYINIYMYIQKMCACKGVLQIWIQRPREKALRIWKPPINPRKEPYKSEFTDPKIEPYESERALQISERALQRKSPKNPNPKTLRIWTQKLAELRNSRFRFNLNGCASVESERALHICRKSPTNPNPKTLRIWTQKSSASLASDSIWMGAHLSNLNPCFLKRAQVFAKRSQPFSQSPTNVNTIPRTLPEVDSFVSLSFFLFFSFLDVQGEEGESRPEDLPSALSKRLLFGARGVLAWLDGASAACCVLFRV